MLNVILIPMSREICRQDYKRFENDPDIYMDMSAYKPFQYSDDWADAYLIDS